MRASGSRWCIKNKPGGDARIGASFVAKAEPDGYTILLTTGGAFVIAPFIGGKPPYDALKDFAPVTLVARTAVLVVAGPKFPVSSIADFVARAKREPGKITYASTGVGGPPHLAAELLKQAAGFDMLVDSLRRDRRRQRRAAARRRRYRGRRNFRHDADAPAKRR